MPGGEARASAGSLLSLAATPTFVIMTLWSAVAAGPGEAICGSGGSALTLSGMPAMYALMSLFHMSPWMALLSRWRNTHEG